MWKLVLISLTAIILSANEHYPSHWWTQVRESKTPSWEILPQAADLKKNEVILSKRNELGLLSNFAATPFSLKKKRYASIEGFWQSLKYPELKLDERSRLTKEWPFKRSEVEQMTAFEAMKAGKKANEIMSKYHITWISFAGEKIAFKTHKKDIEKHYNIIEMATRAKIDQNPEVKKVLLQTGNLTLRPDHHEDKDGTKAWRYYEIYMKLREELKNNPSKKLLPENWE